MEQTRLPLLPSLRTRRPFAPPVYHWTGVSKPPADNSAVDADEGPAAAAGTALFRRLGLSFR